MENQLSRRRWLGATGAAAAISLGARPTLLHDPAARADAPQPASPMAAPQKPAARTILGHWKVVAGEPDVYHYQDGDALVDLFTQAVRDGNGDGIPDLRVSHDERSIVLRSQNLPNHATATYPNRSNPNRILAQNFTFHLPLEPRRAERITRVPMGPIGVAINGVVFFNPFEAGGVNAIEGYAEVWLDSCCGHPQQHGVYHYHKYPTCVRSPFKDDGSRHSPILGFAFDGFPLHGPYESDGKMARDIDGAAALDVCNGHSDEQRGYHYHVTPGRFPYLLGGYAGVPEPSNNFALARAGMGPIENNATGASWLGGAIRSVTPGALKAGSKTELRIELDATLAARWRVPVDAPSWIQLGPVVGDKIAREGAVITAAVEIPADATEGLFWDIHLEFPAVGPRGLPVVLKKNDVARIVAAE